MKVIQAGALVVLVATGAAAQTVPSEPITFGGGRVVLSGDAAASMSPVDEGFFNYSDYEQNTLRQFRLGMTGLFRVSDRIVVLGELRSENLEYLSAFALYARIRPIPDRRLDVQIGRIPPTFGSSSRRTYGHDNPLIGSPLAYQYLTSLRADAVPADVDELFRMRGRGWLANYSIGDARAERGVPLVSAFTWYTCIQVSTGWRMMTVAGAVTTGTASNPRLNDDNSGKQLAARVTVTPTIGLTIGSSVARGEFLDGQVRALLPSGNQHYDQRAGEFDIEYSRDHWLVRAEAVLSQWRMPVGTAGSTLPLRAVSTAIEGRYSIAPGWYGAARVEHLGFNRIASATQVDEWEAPVTRVEAGGGYYLQRNVVAKASLQFNRRDGGRIRSSQLLGVQLLYWF